MTAIERVGVVGTGTMGGGLVQVCALAGADVRVVASGRAGAERAERRLAQSLDRQWAKGRITEAERNAAVARVSFGTELKSLADRRFVLESITESLPAKQDVFRVLDEVVEDPAAVLASNTSSIPIASLGSVTRDPGRVVGAHFFNPVPVMPLVEIIGSLSTSAATSDRAEEFVTRTLGKQVIRVGDRPGFMVNALLVPFLFSAVRMLDAGVADAEGVDRGMTLGCGHPMGPLALLDLIGLDVIVAVGEAMYAESRDPACAPPTLLLRMVECGLTGRKSGRGFHTYP
ncbi:3-hydroxybutyryl-CoA dehydrogenase [Streptomyces olivaceus]|uniref:3-hydroxybutyryl-CoA dehydrogenase n=1 Tax=Streptomyces olivaceus TaxID=47716 RepID=UPI001CC98FE7|nr:3-hydroxybutyryl-CoA dehydrogenase [Streptomyces olivaceus]MBZ6291823.1 3-hydroxybutyryl-CoA dehydrogenase [Streptomyces olivaceus]MBZ6304396.1 3-hydroxybutyryl-CoA dehydrogenase [Streptomyces olivaceus]MBZ6321835.1 3-hydroxybutyryl-CoA dehydrogenase [Streptomyces olivaceus]MBZ6327650.1 3-hydroxybutyryl-CoA dehydrogenase [Streptomyces olivaceus]